MTSLAQRGLFYSRLLTKYKLTKQEDSGIANRKLGRPSGPARSLRLDAHADKIDEYLAKGIDKRSVAKLLDVAPNTLYAWLKVRRPDKASTAQASPPTFRPLSAQQEFDEENEDLAIARAVLKKPRMS
ncbi:MAG: hypothetical protein LW719_01850 [Comamonadaceae bacterium]|nr:hypothetical protein [Comamonadaceae bacterium]